MCTDQLNKMQLLHTNTIDIIQHVTKSSQQKVPDLEEVKAKNDSILIKKFLNFPPTDWMKCIRGEKMPVDKVVNVFNDVIKEVMVEERYKDSEVVLYILYVVYRNRVDQ